MQQDKYQFNNMKRGFTLIEMIVAIGIFSIVLIMGIAAISGTIAANRKSQSSNLVMSNLSLAIEAMSRSIRIGTGYLSYTGSVVVDGATFSCNTGINFTPANGSGSVIYCFIADYNGTGKGAIVRATDDGNGNTYAAAITAPEVVLDDARFRITQTDATSQPIVLVLIQGHAGVVGTASIAEFYLQSSISQRLILSV